MLCRPLFTFMIMMIILLGMAAHGHVWAQTSTSGLPLPRFVTLRAAEVNLRTGPGVRYPVEWVYQKRGLPVEIVAEFDTWRKIRDWQGTQGWVHQSMLSGRRAAILNIPKDFLRSAANPNAPAVAQLEKGVVVRIEQCPDQHKWCEVEIDPFKGWVLRTSLWGLYDHETLNK